MNTKRMRWRAVRCAGMAGALLCLLSTRLEYASAADPDGIQVTETDEEISIVTPLLSAAVRKKGYVSGVKAQSLVDRKTGAHDLGFGLDIADWIMEPGSDAAYRDRLEPELVYETGNAWHGKTAKRAVEGPQICTQAKQLEPHIIRGKDFVAIEQSFHYRTAAPGKQIGSKWSQLLVFPDDTRYFVSMQRIEAVNDSPAMFLRIDMPGHIRHHDGDSFSEMYLSYLGTIPSEKFRTNFAPDEQLNYTRGETIPRRMIRAYHIRDLQKGVAGPWLAGITLDPGVVSEAWCHQRDYVCMIEEFGGRPIRSGESFSAAFIVGYFDDIAQMQQVSDVHQGACGVTATESGWQFVNKTP